MRQPFEYLKQWWQGLSLPQSILFGCVLVLVAAAIFSDSIWIALAAIGTIGAVLVAIFHEWFVGLWRYPVLELKAPGYSTEYFRHARVFGTDEHLYCFDIELKNIGKAIAKNCQPLLTAMWQRDGTGQWQKRSNWVPIGLYWVLDEFAMEANRKPTEERNIIQHRPYFFSLGHVGTNNPLVFRIASPNVPTGQPDKLDSGEYWFEITAFTENADPITKYFYVKYEAPWTVHPRSVDFELIKKAIRASDSNSAPC